MTTKNAAAAWQVRKLIANAGSMIFLGAALAGCGTSTNILSNNQAVKPAAAVAQAPKPAVVKPQRRLAMAPIIGAPDQIAKPLSSQIATAMAQRSIAMAAVGQPSDWTLRGYIVAAKEKAGTKVSYIWDVTDTAGKRVNRITGEEMVAGPAAGKDPWASVSPPLLQKIAGHTADSIAAWVATQQPGAINPAMAQAAPPPPSAAGGPLQLASANGARAGSPVKMASAAPTTGSLGTDSVAAVISPVVGAPGDGAQSLTTAIQRELTRSGVKVGTGSPGSTYRVEGKVVVGAGKDGKQPIQIDWYVKDPKGKKLGTVSQKNEIPQGSLDGAWGQTADAAAAAAAQGIVKLLPAGARTSTN